MESGRLAKWTALHSIIAVAMSASAMALFCVFMENATPLVRGLVMVPYSLFGCLYAVSNTIPWMLDRSRGTKEEEFSFVAVLVARVIVWLYLWPVLAFERAVRRWAVRA